MRSVLVGNLCVAAVWVAAAAGAERGLGDLTGPFHLFVDDGPVAERTYVVRTYHAFEKHPSNPVLRADRPWEGTNIYVYGTALPDETGMGYRLWYHCLAPDATRLCYATSADGIVWTKPNLGLVSYAGSTANNIFFSRGNSDHILSVLHTPWEPDPARAYKMINFDGVVGRFLGAESPDGLRWVDVPGNPIIPPASDVGNFAFDPHERRYIGYLKSRATVNGFSRRTVSFTETKDFLRWPPQYLILTPDAFDDRWATGTQNTQFYGLCGFAYEKGYLGFLWVLRVTRVFSGCDDGTIHVELVSSRDGVRWTRQEGDRPPILPLGPAGTWDDGMVLTTQHPLVVGETIRLYYGGSDSTHCEEGQWRTSIGLATLRKDGFASLDAGSTPATIVTKPIAGAGGPLRVNYRASGGWIKAEVLDAAMNVLPGYGEEECSPLTGDSTDEAVRWATRDRLPGGTGLIRVRFLLRDASIYSFAAGDAAEIVDVPVIRQGPSSREGCPGGAAQFVVKAGGGGTLRYQWQKDGTDLADDGRITGSNTSVLYIASLVPGDAGSYRCVVSNEAGQVVSEAADLRQRPSVLQGVGRLPGQTGSRITGMSADGSVVCGSSGSRAFIWTASGGMQDIGLPGGATTAEARGVGLCAGQVVAAVNTNAPTYRAKRWEGDVGGAGTFIDLPRADGLEWTVSGLGSDGGDAWISGSTFGGGDGGGRQAIRYQRSTDSVLVPALPTQGHDHSDFHAASDNGRFAGQYQYRGTAPTGGARNAMVYVGGTSACESLYTLMGPPSTSVEAIAKAISRDGTVYGGWSYYQTGTSRFQPVVWSSATSVRGLGFLPGGDDDDCGEVLALSGDGALAGGYTYRSGSPAGPPEAFIWDAVHGMRRVADVLADVCGLDVSGWQFERVTAISADGTVLAGDGLRGGVSEGWVAVLGTPRTTPVITQQPDDRLVCPGETTSFSVGTTAPVGAVYQWQKDGVNLRDEGHFAGTTTPTLTVAEPEAPHAGMYRCIVSAGCGSVASRDARLELRPATTIVREPADQVVVPGGTATFSVEAAGEGPVSYQWYRGAAPLADGGRYSGVTTATLTIVGVTDADAGGYQCRARAGCGRAHSRVAVLTVYGCPADFDRDNDVDVLDFAGFQYCFGGAGAPLPSPTCQVADFDGDGDVDVGDFAYFQACFSGPGAAPACGP